MKISLPLILTLCNICLEMASSKIFIVEPEDFSKDVDFVNGTSTVYANFGRVPYGEVIDGELIWSPLDPSGCSLKKLKETYLIATRKNVADYPDKVDVGIVFLLESGGCSFVQKTRNVEKVGGQVALIINRKWKKEDFIMSDDGSGAGLKIPAVLVQYDVGMKLRDEFLKLHGVDQETENVSMEIDNKEPCMSLPKPACEEQSIMFNEATCKDNLQAHGQSCHGVKNRAGEDHQCTTINMYDGTAIDIDSNIQVESAGKGIYALYHSNCDIDYVILHDKSHYNHEHGGEQAPQYAQEKKNDTITVRFDFNLYGKYEHGQEIIDYQIWYTSSDQHSIRLLRHLGVLMKSINQIAVFQPGIVSWDCNALKCDDDFKKKYCLSDGKYCAMGGHDLVEKKGKEGKDGGVKEHIDGSEEMMENLREWCFYKTIKDQTSDGGETLFFSYIERMHELCQSRFSYDCFKVVIKELVEEADFDPAVVGEQIETCVDDSFVSSSSGKKPVYWKDENTVLAAMHEKWISFGHHFYPSVVINNSTFRGEVSPDNVFEGICSAYKVMPEKCDQWFHKQGLLGVIESKLKLERGATMNFTALKVLLAIILVCILACFLMYRRSLNSHIEQEKKIQVESAVKQFIALQRFKSEETNQSTDL